MFLWYIPASNSNIVVVVCYFTGFSFVNRLSTAHPIVLLVSTTITVGMFITSAVILKTRSLSFLPLWQVSCILARETNRYDHNTVCHTHVSPAAPLTQDWAFNLVIICIGLNAIMFALIGYSLFRRVSRPISPQSRGSIQSRLNAFKFDVRNSVQRPVPAHALMLYPGKVWRLEWGDMRDYEMTSRPHVGNSNPISGSAERSEVQSPTSKVYI
jgi:hypothetical protein